MYFVRTPYIIKKLFPEIRWEMPAYGNKIYLTFDDGPHPDITPWILDYLRIHNAKATFFCLGEKAANYPDLVARILSEGHTLANHGYAHLNGWSTNTTIYLQDVKKGLAALPLSYALFRPPYGRIKPSQMKKLSSQTEVINWSLMPGDFDTSISSERCYQNLANNLKPGDIVCLHDNEKARKHLQYCLPKWLALIDNKGLKSEALPLLYDAD